jgi:hypothetical protein
MNEERNEKCLRQVEHIRGNLWHRYSIAVNQVMVVTVKLSKWWLKLTPGFEWGTCYSIFSCTCMLCRSLFVMLYFFIWPLCCSSIYEFLFSLWYLQTTISDLTLWLRRFVYYQNFVCGIIPDVMVLSAEYHHLIHDVVLAAIWRSYTSLVDRNVRVFS